VRAIAGTARILRYMQGERVTAVADFETRVSGDFTMSFNPRAR
jgi:hypothetical protein